MNQRVVFRRFVQQDLAAAFDWYEEQRPGLGEDFLSTITQIFQNIESSPKSHALVRGEVRRAVVHRFPYAVFYIIESNRVVVLRVLHSARNPALWPQLKRK